MDRINFIFMLTLFSVIGRAANANVTVRKPEHSLACFDLLYQGRRNKADVTKDNEGFFVAYRVHGENSLGNINLVKWDEGSKSKYDEIEVDFSFSYNDVRKAVFLNFNVTNNGYFPKVVDLGVFADDALGNKDNSELKLRSDGTGFEVGGGNNFYYTVFVANYTDSPNVDNLFIGSLTNEESADKMNLPYFKNDPQPKSSGDSAYSFSWTNREILPGESIIFGFAVRYSRDNKVPPIITDHTDKTKIYQKGETADISYTVSDTDASQSITIIATFNGNDQEPDTQYGGSKQYTKKVSVGDGPVFEYSISAKDSENFISKTINGKLFVGIVKPKLTLESSHEKEYSVGTPIHIKTKVDTKNKFKVRYQFNNGRIEESSSTEFDIKIPDQVKPGKSYTLYIYAEDEFGLKSNIESFEFQYVEKSNVPQTDATEKPSTPKAGENTANPIDSSKEKTTKHDNKQKNNNLVLTVVLSVVFVVIALIVIAVVIVIYIKKSEKGDMQNMDENPAPASTLETKEESATEMGANV